MDTLAELVEYVEENFGGEVVNPGRRKPIYLSISVEDFDEDSIYEILPDWDGKWTNDESKVNYEGEIIVYTNLVVDSDGESLIPLDDYSDEESESDDEDESEDWEYTNEDNSSWLESDEDF